MKTNLELLIMIIYTTHALPIRYPAKEAQNTRKNSTDTSRKYSSLSKPSLNQVMLNFLIELDKVMEDWESKEKDSFSDPSAEIKQLNTTGRSRKKDTTKVLQLTDSQISQIKENYKTNLTEAEIKLPEKDTEEKNSVHKGISGRSKNHKEPTSDIYIWSSNALTEEQWETIQNNVQENEDEIKYIYDDVEKDVEKYDNHTLKNADGRHRLVNTQKVIEEPKYYSFSKSKWEELKKTLHKHLIGEDEKILKVNEIPSGRNRNEKVESPNLPKWSIWSSYALKPSEWDQLKQNIYHNEFILNKTQNNINPVGRGRSKEGDSLINGNDVPSTEDHINAVIIKPVTGERLYNLRKTFDWDGLLESISSKDINSTDEGKEDISIVDGSVGYNNQTNVKNENPIKVSKMSRSRIIGLPQKIIGIMPSLVLDDDENIPNFEDNGSEPLFIEKDNTVGLDENNFDSNKITSISIQDDDLNIQNTEQTAINFVSDSPDSELKNNEHTFTPSPIHLTEDILDYDTTAPVQLNPNSTRENHIFQQSIESDISASTIAYETSDTEKYVTESVGDENITREDYIFQQSVTEQTAIHVVSDSPNSELKNNEDTFTPSIHLTEDILDYDTTAPVQLKPNSTREHYIFQQSIESDISASTIAYETSDTEKYVTESSIGDENITREDYIFQQSVVSDNSTSIISYDTTDTEMYDTTESVEFYNSTREIYIKIKPVTDSTEIMDSSTFTQNNDSNDTTVINDKFTANTLNVDLTHYTNIYDHTTEQDYSINKNESEYTPINDNTTTEVFIINLSENDIVVSTAEVINFKENKSVLYYGSTTSQGDETTTSANDTIYLIDTESSNMLGNASLINLSEFVTTDDYKSTLITDIISPDTLENVTDSLLDNYSSPLIQNDISTVSQVNESTTEGESYGLFGLFGLFDKSNSKMTTMNSINDLAVNESITISVMDPSTTTDSSLSVIIDDDYVVKENRFDIPEDILLSTTEILLGNNGTTLILEKETFLGNIDSTLNLSSQEAMMDEEMILFTTDHLDSISEYFSTTKAEELEVDLLNSDPVSTSIEDPLPVNDSLSIFDLEMNKATTNVGFEIEKATLNSLNTSDLGEMASSDVMITTVDLNEEEISRSTVQYNNDNLNISSDVNNQSEDPKNEEENLNTTFIPSSSADVSENMSLKSSDILSTTQDMEPNEVGIDLATEKLPNEAPYQPQELIGNEIPIISTTARPTTIELTPLEPVSSNMPTWIILLIVLILSLIVFAVGFLIVLRLKRQRTGHVQLSP